MKRRNNNEDTTIAPKVRRRLGTMVVHGFPKVALVEDLAIARRLGAEVVEILPNWRTLPDPKLARIQSVDHGLTIHSAHGCWGGQSIRASRVDLGSPDHTTWTESVADLRLCIDWLAEAGGRCLVVHPGGLSDPLEQPFRQDRLARGLLGLADHARGTNVLLCVENMPPGVYPGSRMADLARLVECLQAPEVGLAVDTGHAHIANSTEEETRAASSLLRTTHVHDNDGRSDVHLPPGSGTIDWRSWVQSLDAVGYRGPIVLECIRHLRDHPESINEDLLNRLRRMCGMDRAGESGSTSSDQEG